MSAILKGITLEPAIFLQTFTWGLQSVISQNLIIDKVCRDEGFNATVCKDINSHPKENDQVEKSVAQLNMYMSILSALPSIVIALFVGPWSDKNGRKPVMILPLIGYCISAVIWILNVYFWDLSAQCLLSTCVYSFFGSFTCLLIGLYSYISDITTVRARTTRIAILDFFLFIGLPLGTFVSAYIFTYIGYYGVFGITLGCQVISLLYIVIFVKDTRGPFVESTEIPLSYDIILRNYLFVVNYKHVLDVFRVSFKKRENGVRRVIIILIVLMLLNVSVFSDSSLFYLYARKEFHWDEQEYTKFQTLAICFSVLASLVFMPILSYKMMVPDSVIGVLASLSKMSSLIVTSISTSGKLYYFAASIGCISSLSAIVIRSMLSKCVSPLELGKVFSLLASCEAAVPLMATPLFTEVFNTTIDKFIGATFLLEAGIFLVAVILFFYLSFIFPRAVQSMQQTDSEEDRDGESPISSNPDNSVRESHENYITNDSVPLVSN